MDNLLTFVTQYSQAIKPYHFSHKLTMLRRMINVAHAVQLVRLEIKTSEFKLNYFITRTAKKALMSYICTYV